MLCRHDEPLCSTGFIFSDRRLTSVAISPASWFAESSARKVYKAWRMSGTDAKLSFRKQRHDAEFTASRFGRSPWSSLRTGSSVRRGVRCELVRPLAESCRQDVATQIQQWALDTRGLRWSMRHRNAGQVVTIRTPDVQKPSQVVSTLACLGYR